MKELEFMRRNDRKMDKEFGMQIIDKAEYGVVSMIDGDKPYGLPLSIVRIGDTLYFHSAKEGRKVDILTNHPRISITFVGEKTIPENYSFDELEEMNNDPSKAIQFISSVFTTEFESAIVTGELELVDHETEKIQAMRKVCEKYTPDKMKYFDTAVNAGLHRTNVYKVKIEDITSKRKKYDDQGVEMKWARME